MTGQFGAAWITALLERDAPAEIGAEAVDTIAGKRVVVTGAAGSIGSEIVRQTTRLGGEVFMLDVDESRMHALKLELSGRGLLDDDTVVLADVRDRKRMHRVMRELRPDVVFHAAAHKHLQLLERYPCEGAKTNVLGTDNAVEASMAADVERFVLISTDKAADPSSVLGASKLMAERVVLDAAGGSMNVASVRFGNVLGSRGSLLDTLRWQLVNGLPIQITDPAVSRFFMSIPEAVGLVLEAGAMADAGETYVLDMGEPVRIMDIVERLARLMQIEVGEVTFSGLRAGEKLHEVLFAPGEMAAPTRHARIRVSRREAEASSSGAILRQRLSQLYRLAYKDDDVHTRQMLTVLARDESAAPCRTLAAV